MPTSVCFYPQPFPALAFALSVIGAGSAFANAPVALPAPLQNELGTTVLKTISVDDAFGTPRVVGDFLQYLPATLSASELPILVMAHGTTDNNDASAEQAAREFFCDGTGYPFKIAARWKTWADRHQVMLVCPLFTNTNYGAGTSSDSGSFAGYRGMLGRHDRGLPARTTDPDGFVNAIVDDYQRTYPGVFQDRMYILGHSAGGQFVARYLVAHLNRIGAAVLSSSGSFAGPAQDVPWPNGRARRSIVDLTWSGTSERNFWFHPLWWDYIVAAKAPVMVTFGRCEVQTNLPADCNCLTAGPGASDICLRWPAQQSAHYDGMLGQGENYVLALRANAGLGPLDPGMVLNTVAGEEHYPEAGTDQSGNFIAQYLGCRSFFGTLANHFAAGRALIRSVGFTSYYFPNENGNPGPVALGPTSSPQTQVELFENEPNWFETATGCSWFPARPRAPIWNDAVNAALTSITVLSL